MKHFIKTKLFYKRFQNICKINILWNVIFKIVMQIEYKNIHLYSKLSNKTYVLFSQISNLIISWKLLNIKNMVIHFDFGTKIATEIGNLLICITRSTNRCWKSGKHVAIFSNSPSISTWRITYKVIAINTWITTILNIGGRKQSYFLFVRIRYFINFLDLLLWWSFSRNLYVWSLQ